jgi:hypothetical protein
VLLLTKQEHFMLQSLRTLRETVEADASFDLSRSAAVCSKSCSPERIFEMTLLRWSLAGEAAVAVEGDAAGDSGAPPDLGVLVLLPSFRRPNFLVSAPRQNSSLAAAGHMSEHESKRDIALWHCRK